MIPEFFNELLTAPGPSGYESVPADIWRQEAKTFTEKVSSDTLGSSTATVEGNDQGPHLAVIGHIDEIGIIVKHISDEGFLYFDQVGGWDPQILVGQRVELLTSAGALYGVVGKKPIHLLKPEERKKVTKLSDMHIDIGVEDGDEAKSLVRIGDVAVITGEPMLLPHNRVCSRSLDNRVGSYVAAEVARKVAEAGGAPGSVTAVAAVQEEITMAGSRTTAYSVDPDLAVVVDVTFASDAPGIDVKEVGKHELGSGPVISRGATLNPKIFELLYAAGKEQDIPFTVQASTGRTGTDADAVHITKSGIPCSVVSVPLRYMHSPVEMIQLSDIQATVDLIAAFAMKLSSETSFER